MSAPTNSAPTSPSADTDAEALPSRVTEGIHTDFARSMGYGEYLRLDLLLSAQQPLSAHHDEMLFITIHHVQEVWLKLITHEMRLALDSIRRDALDPAFKALARVSRIQTQMIGAWDVLSTMTPADYLSFRGVLGKSSGFQSFQYRMLEFLLGAKDAKMMLPHRHDAAAHAALDAALRAPSLYDEAIRLLARRGFDLPRELLERDLTQPHRHNPELQAAWLRIYREAETHFDLYQLAEELVDVEDSFQQWRFRHMKTVERIIGFRQGTGGSAGVAFLRTALERSFFPELWQVRTEI
ncbi:tryptophan 2,3-dioxygenase [Roseomonas gilardii]|uniref:Tryptophan 2,3-dioxygenase n=1 Tax=Roseomonas gilardii TaxID=257708 RepID=A0ABU3MI32_9PROT|nr:tryptophan 2,3-dioxygenase [Roseomonas gilardii]MDT8332111.1 tryptophan 2,3-dioxygenase [Roseomonas gilardii]